MVDAASGGPLSIGDMLSQMREAGVDVSDLEPSNGNIYGEGRKPETAEDRQTKLSDYPKAVATGATNAVSGLGATIEYGTDGQYGTDLRKTGEAWTKGISDTISPAGQHALNASFLPDTGDDSAYKEGILRTVGLQAAGSIFSLVSTILPGTMAGKIALRMGASAAKAGAIGGGVARSSAALQNLGGSAQQIHSSLDKMTDDELMESPVYRQMRDQGMPEREARSRLYQKVDGIAPVVNGALTFMLAAPEANAAKAGIAGAAKREGAKGALKMGAGELGEEFGEGVTQEATTEQALTDAKLGDGLHPYKILGQGVTGAVTGFAMGTGMGVYAHGLVAPDQKLAIEKSLGPSVQEPEKPQQALPIDQPAVSTGEPPSVPEKPATLAMQAQQLAEGKRTGIFVPNGSDQIAVPDGMEVINTLEGDIYFNPQAVGRNDVLVAATEGRLNELLGYVQSKPEAAAASAQQGVPPTAVVSKNAQGQEQDAAIVSPDQINKQAQIFADRAQPGSTVSVESPDGIIAERLGQTVVPLPDHLAQRVAGATRGDEIGDAGLNRIPPQDDPDLIRYDDGTVRSPNEPPAPQSTRPPLWPEADKFSVSPTQQADADEYYAERNAERDPLEGPAQDDDFVPWQYEPARDTQAVPPVADDAQTMEKPKVHIGYNPERKRIDLGVYSLDVGAPDAIAFIPPTGTKDAVNFYDRDQRKHYGRRDEAYLDEMDAQGVPELLQPYMRGYLKGEMSPQDIVDDIQQRMASSKKETNTSEVTLPEGVGPLGAKALGGTTTASKRKTRRGEAALVAKKSREARYAALQNPEPEKPASTPFRDRLQKTIDAIEGLKRKPTQQEQEKLAWAKRRLEGPPTDTKIGADVLKALSGDEAPAKKSSEDRHVSNKTKAAEQKLAKGAETAFGANTIVEEKPSQGAMFRENDPRDITKPSVRTRLKERIRKFLAAVEKAGGALPKNASKNTPDHVRYALAARKALTALNNPEFGDIERDIVQRFLAADIAARQGDFGLIVGAKNEGDGIGTAGMETRAETADDAVTSDEVSEENKFAKGLDPNLGKRLRAMSGTQIKQWKARYVREQLLEEVERQINENGEVDIEALRKFAKGLDPNLGKRLRAMSGTQIKQWAATLGQDAGRALGMDERLERFGEAVKGELVRQREAANGGEVEYDLDALNRVAQKADANLAKSAQFKSADDVDAFERRERVRRERRIASKKTGDEGRRVAVDDETATSLVTQFEEAKKAAEKAKKEGAPPTYEDWVTAEKQEAQQKSVAEKQREIDRAARNIQKDDESKFDPELKAKRAEEAEKQRRREKAAQRREDNAKRQGVLLKQGVFSEVDAAEAEAEVFRRQAQQDYAEGMEEEAANPSVFELDGVTYLQGDHGIVPSIENTSVGELLDRGFRYGATNPRLTEFVTALIRKNAADVPVHIVTLADMQTLMPGADGYYHPSGYIVLPYELTKQAPETFNQVVVHEALHAALADKLNKNPVALAQVHALAEYLKQQSGIPEGEYLWKSAHEFLSEVLSRGDLQERLRNTPLTPELARMLGVADWRQKSVWRAFMEKIADWLGYRGPMNALEGVLAVTERIDSGNMSANQDVAEYTRTGWPHPNEPIGSFKPLASMGAFNREDVTNKVNDFVETSGSKNRAAQLIVKTLDQIRQTFGRYFNDSKGNAIDAVVAAIQKVGPYAAKLREQSDKLAQRFLDLPTDIADELANLFIDTTVANVQLGDGANNDHLKGWHSWQGKLALPDLTRRYNALKAKSPEAARLYNDAKKYFRDTQNEQARSTIAADLTDAGVKPKDLEKFIDRVIANKMTEADKNLFLGKPTALKNILDAAQARVVKGDYFPLMRNGHHVVVTINEIKDTMGGVEGKKGEVEFRGKTFKQAQAKAEAFAKKMYSDGMTVISVTPTPVSTDSDYGVVVKVQRLGFHTFENEMEARAWKRDNAGDYDQVSEVQKGLETGLNPADLTVAQRNRIMNAFKRQEGLSEEMKDALGDVAQQVFAGMMSGNRIQQRSITRRRVKGASKAYGRILLQYGEAATTNLARTKFMPEYREAYDRMSALAKDTMRKDAPVLVDVLNEVSKRWDTGVEKPSEPPGWMQTAMSLTFLGRLASPMHSVINGMQVGMVTFPVLAAKFKAARAGQAIISAYGAVGVSDQVMAGLRNTWQAGKNLTSISLDLKDTAGSVKNNLKSEKDGAELVKLIDMLQERGGMAVGGFELAQSISRGSSKAGIMLAQLDRAARQLPSAVEDINRAVSAVAAYRLARADGMTDEAARNYAFDVVMNTQGDYSGVNAPRFFSNNYLRPALQFKKYAQMMTVLLLDAGHKALAKGSTMEERKEAGKFLLNIVGVQMAMAGALSLPGLELVKAGFMIAAAFGMGDGWEEEEERLNKIAEETFGKDWGEMLSKGILSRALNLDFSGRLSLSDQWLPMGEPESYDANGISAYLAKGLFGAPYSSVSDVRQGIADAAKGEWLDDPKQLAGILGKVVPIKVLADAFKAGNNYSQGKATATEVVMNTLGVRSGRQAEESRKVGVSIRERERWDDVRQDLSKQYLRADNAGQRAKIRARIVAHNKATPVRYHVNPGALDRYVRTRMEQERVN